MKAVEDYIKKYTRNCSNEILVNGDKSYTNIPSKRECHPWLTPDEARRAVEIAREEVIEKACEFLDNDLCCYIKAQDFAIEHQRLENDLKQAIKR